MRTLFVCLLIGWAVLVSLLVSGCGNSSQPMMKPSSDLGGCMGTLGCACDPTGACSDGSFCNNSRMCAQPMAGCTPGSLECACAGGGCDSGLRCVDSVCRDNSGFTGGACLMNNRCHSGNRCADGTCVACTPGAQGCTCTAAGCNETLDCQDGMCVTSTGYAAAPAPADENSCVTGCSAGMVAPDGTYVPCPSDGVMNGCLPGMTCQTGQCVCPNGQAKSCTSDVDCADYNACINGGCRSNCDVNADCQSGAVCVRRVCRKSCDIAKADCPSGLVCQPSDGQTGICLMRADGLSDAAAQAATLSVSSGSLRFSPASASGDVTISNTSGFDSTVVVRKESQQEPDPMTLQPITLDLLERESAPPITAGSCTTGTRGCKCGSDSTRPCIAPSAATPAYSLVCENSLCQLPTCSAGGEGCVCQGSDCRLLCEPGHCPLAWLKLSISVAGTQVVNQSSDMVVSFLLPAGKSAVLHVANPTPQDGTWDGTLEIEPRGSGATRTNLLLTYTKTPDGHWSGQMHYFGDFLINQTLINNQTALDRWQGSRAVISNDSSFDKGIDAIGNAFLEKWANFRRGRIDYKSFLAVLTATESESWRAPTLQQVCDKPHGWICYPADNSDGWDIYTYSPSDSPVPAGVVPMPFAISLAGVPGDVRSYSGAVDSSVALQYPGGPPLTMTFAGDPAACKPDAQGNCIAFLDTMTLTSLIGGHYDQPAGTSCPTRYRSAAIPWMVPGFFGRSTLDAASGRRYVHECREAAAPFPGSDDLTARRNGDLSGANPLLDGNERTRRVDLIDGAIINSDTMLILFVESTPALVNGQDESKTKAYGIITLKRENHTGNVVTPSPLPALVAPPLGAAPVLSCANATDLLAAIGARTNYTAAQLAAGANWPLVARALLTGQIADDTPANQMNDANHWTLGTEQVHYLCEDTKVFDGGGPLTNADLGINLGQCPADSRVTYFSVNPNVLSNDTIVGNACQQTQTCDKLLESWRQETTPLVFAPNWRCADNSSSCSSNRGELRQGKIFYPQSANAVFLPLSVAVDQAFSYRTRFVNRNGTNVGFAPAICGTVQQPLPYCYSPDEIATLQRRHDCLSQVFLDHYDLLDDNLRAALGTALQTAFSDSVTMDTTTNQQIVHPGFEKLYAELVIMLGDDAYTQALSSRFDLAGLSVASFEGTLLEPGGINLSGVAGAEMFNLYLATQYHQLALERVGALLPTIWRLLIERPGIVGQAMAEELLGRAITASSHKAVVHGEIATRYSNLDLPDVARHVIERGYIAGYLESMVFSTLMKSIARHADQAADVPQIRAAINTAQVTYRAGLTSMAEQHGQITDDVNFFGLPRDYIPFPALEAQIGRDSAFDVAIQRAKDRIAIAQQAEDVALTTARSFDSDAVSFQNELTKVANDYENQLTDLCGTLTAGGTVYPAIAKYAYLDPKARFYGDPCGRMGTGQIAQSVLNIDQQQKELARIEVALKNVQYETDIEEARIEAACNTNNVWEQTVVKFKDSELTVGDAIRSAQTAIADMDRYAQFSVQQAALLKCTLGTADDCENVPTAEVALGLAQTLLQANATLQQSNLMSAEQQQQKYENQEASIQFKFMCGDGTDGGVPPGQGLLQIDSAAKVQTILLQTAELQAEAARQEVVLTQAFAQTQQLLNQAQRIAAQMDQNIQNTINLEAARNDPNFRIYSNDAIIQADFTFQEALRETYRATRVYEYYTSQTYPDRDKLFLSRMVSRGDDNLQAYELGLEDAFHSFEDDEGVPDLRVAVLSLRDDLLHIPYLNQCGEPVSTNDRVKLMQKQLSDPSKLDGNGYIVVPFRIGPEQVSPLTRDHKIRFVEAQIVGGNGDQVGRVYLREAGASMVSTLDDQLQLYSFPLRTGVIDVFFSVKSPEYDPNVFRTNRFVDRPLMNSRWELVLNMKDEPANLDFAVTDINDVRLYFYYADFTKY